MKFLKTLVATILIFVSCLFISACGTGGCGGSPSCVGENCDNVRDGDCGTGGGSGTGT